MTTNLAGKICADCRHYNFSRSPFNDTGVCELGESEDGAPVNFNTMAYAHDAEGYHAELIVRPTFACVQWEANP